MALVIDCHRCGQELGEPGGLLFSEPRTGRMHSKIHLCTPCFLDVERFAAVDPPEGPEGVVWLDGERWRLERVFHADSACSDPPHYRLIPDRGLWTEEDIDRIHARAEELKARLIPAPPEQP